MRMPTAFGIDFGTTNTRIAFHNGGKTTLVPVRDQRGISYNIPSVVGYRRGKATTFGHDALTDRDATLCRSIKWLLAQDYPIEIDGRLFEPVEVVSEFFKYLRKVVREAELTKRDLTCATFSVPVNFSLDARKALCDACERAGIEVELIFHEPVSALYSDAMFRQDAGYFVVFDWGGGTLDIAVGKIDGEYVHILGRNGLKRGGDDFDTIVIEKAFSDFERKSGTPSNIIDKVKQQKSTVLKLEAEKAKIQLSRSFVADIIKEDLIPNFDMDYRFDRKNFEDWIRADIEEAMVCLKQGIDLTGIPLQAIRRLIYSGGTCNIPAVQQRLVEELGIDRVESAKPIGVTDDVGMGTAVGNALLTVHGARPVFAKEVGILLANHNNPTNQYLRSIFTKNSHLKVNEPVRRSFNVVDGRREYITLQIYEKDANSVQIKGMIEVPIDRRENDVNVTFSVDSYLVLKVEGAGRRFPIKGDRSECLVLDILLAFKIPDRIEGIQSNGW